LDDGAELNLVEKKLLQPTNEVLPLGGFVVGIAGEETPIFGPVFLPTTITDEWGVTKTLRTLFWAINDPLINDHPMILGMPWHEETNPIINYREKCWVYPSTEDIRIPRASKRALKRALAKCKIAVTVTSHRIPESRDASRAIMEQYYSGQAKAFEQTFDIQPHSDADHAIDLEPGTKPPWGPIYCLAADELETLRDYLADAQQKGWIRPSTSEAGAPILFVPKKGGGKPRLCVDYRGLNKITKKNRCAIPLIGEILDRLANAKWFTKLDLKDAYHRIRIKCGDEWKTAFRTKYGLYEYLVLPFGLTNAPATFQAYINRTLTNLVDVICIVYLDDILIYSPTFKEHTEHVATVLERLIQWGLYVNIDKCTFHT